MMDSKELNSEVRFLLEQGMHLKVRQGSITLSASLCLELPLLGSRDLFGGSSVDNSDVSSRFGSVGLVVSMSGYDAVHIKLYSVGQSKLFFSSVLAEMFDRAWLWKTIEIP